MIPARLTGYAAETLVMLALLIGSVLIWAQILGIIE